MTELHPNSRIAVWDPFVRIFHWSQAALIGAAWIMADDRKALHEKIGYAIAILVTLRIVWGFVGPQYARFSDFLRGPKATIQYLGDLARGRERRMLGHNPAGGAMILALLATVAGTATTGWLQTTNSFWGSSLLEDVHEGMATAILVLVAGHVLGVLVESLRQRENLTAAMVTGKKRPLGNDEVNND